MKKREILGEACRPSQSPAYLAWLLADKVIAGGMVYV